MKGKEDSHEFKTDGFRVLLGVHNYTNSDETGRITADVKSIYIHPDWNTFADIYEADVAILELENEIQFNSFIQPICLASPQSSVAKSLNGIAVGFGRSNGLSQIARKLDISIINYHDCINDRNDYGTYMSARSMCGGSTDGHGICQGDTGIGHYVKQNEKFYLRGISSVSFTNAFNECDTTREAIYTDATRFYSWIKSGGLNKFGHC